MNVRASNSYDFVRFCAASAVLFSHQFSLSLRPEPAVPLYGEDFGKLAVEVFFCLSGFLICQSLQKNPDWAEFLSARHVLIASMGSGHQALERTLSEHGVQDNVALRVPHFVVVPLIVAGTDLIVSLPSRVADATGRLVKVKVHPLPIAIPSFDVMMYWHERVDNDPANQWLRNAVQELFGDQAATRKRLAA